MNRFRIILCIFSFVIVSSIILFAPKKASAIIPLNPDPGASIPWANWDYLKRADGYAWTPAFSPWIALQSNAASTSITVPYGTPTIDLAWYSSTAVGWGIANGHPRNSGVTDSTQRVVNIYTAGVSPIIGGTIWHNYRPDYNTIGTYRAGNIPFTLSPPGAFIGTSGPDIVCPVGAGYCDYHVKLGFKGINAFDSGIFLCVGGQQNQTTSLSNYVPCNEFISEKTIRVRNFPNVTVSGRVFNINNPAQGYPGVRITTCGPPGTTTSTLTNASGNYSFSYPGQVNHCVRIDSTTYPGGTSGRPFLRPWGAQYGLGTGAYGSPGCPGYGNPKTGYCTNPSPGPTSYEWQVAGAACMGNATFCGNGKIGGADQVVHFDRNSDTGFDFVFLGGTPPPDSPPIVEIIPNCLAQTMAIRVKDPDGGPLPMSYRIYKQGAAPGVYVTASPSTKPAVPGAWATWNISLNTYSQLDTWKIQARSRGHAPPGRPLGPLVYSSPNPVVMSPCILVPGNFTCSVTPSTAEALVPTDFTFRINSSAGGGVTIDQGTNPMTLTVTGPDPSSVVRASKLNAPYGTVPPGSSGSYLMSITLPSVGVYKVTMSVVGIGIVGGCDGNATGTVIHAVTKPYFTLEEGDIATGTGDTLPSAVCTGWGVSNAGTLTAWNNGVSGATNRGAGTNLAAYAVGVIDGFASGQPTSGSSPPKDLSFANTAGVYGGGFGGNIPCPTDYYSNHTQATPSGPLASVPNSNTDYDISGNITLAGGGITTAGKRSAIFVDGDVYITNNITLAQGSTLGTLSSFYLVVKGDIYISPNVTQLDGVYIAQPNGASGGRIYTCTDSTGMAHPDSSDLNGACKTPLTVKGAFIAKELKLYRSIGSLSLGGPAEIFNFTPATWLVAPRSIGTGNLGGYDAITSLPPVL